MECQTFSTGTTYQSLFCKFHQWNIVYEMYNQIIMIYPWLDVEWEQTYIIHNLHCHLIVAFIFILWRLNTLAFRICFDESDTFSYLTMCSHESVIKCLLKGGLVIDWLPPPEYVLLYRPGYLCGLCDCWICILCYL